MMVDHMKRTHGVSPSDVRFFAGDSKAGVRQVPQPSRLTSCFAGFACSAMGQGQGRGGRGGGGTRPLTANVECLCRGM